MISPLRLTAALAAPVALACALTACGGSSEEAPASSTAASSSATGKASPTPKAQHNAKKHHKEPTPDVSVPDTPVTQEADGSNSTAPKSTSDPLRADIIRNFRSAGATPEQADCIADAMLDSGLPRATLIKLRDSKGKSLRDLESRLPKQQRPTFERMVDKVKSCTNGWKSEQ